MQWIAVGIGGCVGAMARYGVSGFLQKLAPAGFALGTLGVNLIGCVLLGAGMAVVQHRPGLPDTLRLMLLTGGLGAFTTFSTYSFDGLSLLQRGQYGLAMAYLVGSVVAGLLLAFVGFGLVGVLLR